MVSGVRFVVNGKNAPNSVLIQVKTECQVDLLCNARTAESRVALSHFYDGCDDFFGWSFWPWFSASTRRMEQTVLAT